MVVSNRFSWCRSSNLSAVRTALVLGALAAFSVAGSRPLVAQDCAAGWTPLFGGDGRFDDTINALAVFDSGAGAELHAAGDFELADGSVANHIARWDGTRWRPLAGSGLNGEVEALVVFDDGTGPALFAGGFFGQAGGQITGALAKWDGASWSAVGGALSGVVEALHVHRENGVETLIVGGLFTRVGGINVNNIARWDGTNWSRLGGGTNSRIRAITTYDDGTGPRIVAAGRFTIAAPAQAPGIAQWNGTDWEAMGAGLPANAQTGVLALQSLEEGGAEVLYAGGRFRLGSNSVSTNFARFDGSTWSSPGSPVSDTVRDMKVYRVDAQSPEALYIGGRFQTVGGILSPGIARWTGSSWDSVGLFGDQAVEVHALQPFDSGSGMELFAAGSGLYEDEVVRWSGGAWTGLPATGLDQYVSDMIVHDDGSGPALFLSRGLTNLNTADGPFMLKWDGTSLSSIGPTFTFGALAFEIFDDGAGNGPELYAGGRFTLSGTSTQWIAKWNGTTWDALGSGLAGTQSVVGVWDLEVYDDGSGPALYVAGSFDLAGGLPARGLAKWDGTNWSSAGGSDVLRFEANTLQAIDDGSGPALYVGGILVDGAGIGAEHIARLDGNTWSLVGTNQLLNRGPFSMEVFDDGNGPRLYASGSFFDAAGVLRYRMARLDGSAWTLLTPTGYSAYARDLLVHDPEDGTGSSLYLTGGFTNLEGVQVQHIARFDGQLFHGLGGGLEGQGFALASFDDGNGKALYAGGSFAASSAGDSFLARWKGCGELDSFCLGNGGAATGCTPCPCGNGAAANALGGCLNSVARSAELSGSGTTSVAQADLRFEVQGAPPSSVALLISGNAALPAQGPCPAGSGIASTAFDGLRCTGLGIRRHGIRAVDLQGRIGVTNAGWGPPDGPPGGIAPSFGLVSGQSRFFQAIYRDDPAAQCGTGLNTTNGVRVLFR